MKPRSRTLKKVLFLVCAPFLFVILTPVVFGIKLAEAWQAYSEWYDRQFKSHD